MEHRAIGTVNGLYPSLTTIVGCVVNGKANWMTVAHVGILNHATGDKKQYLGVSVNPAHYSSIGIHEHGEFSINIPSRAMLEATDHVGIVSGKSTDKSGLFPTFKGQLEFAPMISDCPLTMECRLHQTVVLGKDQFFIGELVQTYVDEACLIEGDVDLKKIDPILFDFMRTLYWSLGEVIGKPWSEGKVRKHTNSQNKKFSPA